MNQAASNPAPARRPAPARTGKGNTTMPEFDRRAAILAELDRLDGDDLAQTAQITFRTQDDQGTLADLRSAIAEEYRTGRAEVRDRWRTAGRVGERVAGHGELVDRFAAVSHIDDMQVIYEDGSDTALGRVPVGPDDTVGQVMAAALALRFAHAAHALLTYLEDWADDEEPDHDDTDDTGENDTGENDTGENDTGENGAGS